MPYLELDKETGATVLNPGIKPKEKPMAAGLSSEAKRSRTRRFFNKQAQYVEKYFTGVATKRNGAKSLTVYNVNDIARGFAIQLRWGNFSNGESIGTVYVNGVPAQWTIATEIDKNCALIGGVRK